MRKFFLEDFGLWTVQHLLFFLCAMGLLWLLFFLYHRFWKQKEKGVLIVFSSLLWGLEVIKICYVIFYLHDGKVINDWVPLYFCSLTLYASLLSAYGKGAIRRLGDSFLFYGGIVSGFAFLCYPSSSLAIYPLLSFRTLHSLVYHVISVFLGVMIAWDGYFKPQHKDILSYLIFTYSFALIAYIVNLLCNSNFMFIREPWSIVPLQWIEKVVGPLYPFVIATGQNIGTFYISFGLYQFVKKVRQKKDVS